MADCDEDVVYEGSELHKYLVANGLTDFEVVSPSHDNIPHNIGYDRSVHRNWKYKELWEMLKFSIFQWLVFIQDGVFGRSEYDPYLGVAVDHILNSHLLFEEDAQLVENVKPDINHEAKKIYSSRSLKAETIALGGSCVIGSLSLWCYSSQALILALSVSFFILVYLCWKWRKLILRTHRIQKIISLVKLLQDFRLTLKKSLKLVQENDLILRGFTLVNTGSQVWRLEDSTLTFHPKRWQLMPGLRIAIYEFGWDASNLITSATRELLKAFPLAGHVDNVNHYLSFMELEDLSLPKYHPEKTVDLSIKVLQDVYHTYLLLQSEFLRRLSLCFCPDLWLKGSNFQLDSATEISARLSISYSDLLKDLNRDYKLFSSYGVSESKCSEEDNASTKQDTPKKDYLKFVDPYVAVHSAGLHLQSLLMGVRSVEEMLEKEEKVANIPDEEGKEKINNVEGLQEIEDQLTKLLEELISCRDCFDEALGQISKLKCPRNEVPHSPPPTPVDDNKSETSVKSPIPVGYTDLDPKVQDEIFEAYITHEICDSDGESDYFALTSEEKQKKQEEKEHSRRLLQELKVVLIEKARQWKDREAKAIHKISDNKKSRIEKSFKNVLPEKEKSNCKADIGIPLGKPEMSVDKIKSASDILLDGREITLPKGTVNLKHKKLFSLDYSSSEFPEAQAKNISSKSDLVNSLSSCQNSTLCADQSIKDSFQYVSDTSTNLNILTAGSKTKVGSRSGDDSVELPLGIDCLESSPLWPLPRFKRPAPKHRAGKSLAHIRNIRASSNKTSELEKSPIPGFDTSLALQAVAKFQLFNTQQEIETYCGAGEDSDCELVEEEKSKNIS